MSLAVKISLAASGLYLLGGMLVGIVKYRRTMTSREHRAPVYIDIAHRAFFMYSFASLVMARLAEENIFSERTLVAATVSVLVFFTVTVLGYLAHGLRDDTDNIFAHRNFTTTWYMYALIVAEIGGLGVILWGFLARQFGGAG
ncbi:MAG TPA: hypothetical protein VFX96_07105 [Pyrinomonadaceae bacterium]|nr:hypothetical protein [Pyrinomonadaceae bacterium]